MHAPNPPDARGAFSDDADLPMTDELLAEEGNESGAIQSMHH